MKLGNTMVFVVCFYVCIVLNQKYKNFLLNLSGIHHLSFIYLCTHANIEKTI